MKFKLQSLFAFALAMFFLFRLGAIGLFPPRFLVNSKILSECFLITC